MGSCCASKLQKSRRRIYIHPYILACSAFVSSDCDNWVNGITRLSASVPSGRGTQYRDVEEWYATTIYSSSKPILRFALRCALSDHKDHSPPRSGSLRLLGYYFRMHMSTRDRFRYDDTYRSRPIGGCALLLGFLLRPLSGSYVSASPRLWASACSGPASRSSVSNSRLPTMRTYIFQHMEWLRSALPSATTD